MNSMRLIQTADMKCDDAAIATVATWWGRNYEMAFSQLWDFKFLPEDTKNPNLIGTRIKTPDELSKYINLQKYHDILTTRFDCKDSEEFEHLLLEEVKNGHPVMMEIDPRNKPWATKRELTDNLSFILAYDFDRAKNGLICLDIHGSKKVEFLPMQNFVQECKSRKTFYFGAFSKLEQKEIQIDWKEFLLNSVNNICKNPENDYFGAIKSFADSFENIDLELECSDSNFYMSPICWNMKNICRYRNLYALSLEYLSKKCNKREIDDIAKMFIQAGSKWYLGLALLTKSVYVKSINKDIIERIKKAIYNAADFEKEICESIYKLCDTGSLAQAKNFEVNSKDKISGKRFYNLPLDKYFNNKAFYTDEHIEDFDGTFSCFLKDGLPESGLVSVGEKTFDMRNCLLPKMDNISCRSQTINIDFNERISGIYFLCCAEWGNFYENIKIIYKDNHTENCYVTFADWIYKTTYQGLTIAWQGKGMYENREKTADVFIFEQAFPVNNEEIKAIELPYLPNCHIFAITLSY